jgi:O-antigen ligase
MDRANLPIVDEVNRNETLMNQQAPSPVNSAKRTPWFPFPLRALAFGMLVSYLPGLLPTGFGVDVSFLGWMAPLLASLWHLIGRRRVRFPLMLWVPWALWVLAYLPFAEAENALQRSVMMLTPLVIGAAFSTFRLDACMITTCHKWINRFLWVFLGAAAVSTGLARGTLYGATGFAAGSITASLLACWFAAHYVISRDVKSLCIWLVLAVVPVLAVTRTGMAAVALTLPLTLTPWPWTKRVLVVGLIAVAGLAVFQSERIQTKMFFSGQGSLEDAVVAVTAMLSGTETNIEDFATSGRSSMNRALVPKLEEAYWLGHGANTTEAIAYAVASVTHPHNDWLKLRYEYGHLGMVIFVLTILAQLIHGWRFACRVDRDFAIFAYAGSAAFIPMAIFMFSDNVILYAAWFGNLQFAMLGLGYAAMNQRGRPQLMTQGVQR